MEGIIKSFPPPLVRIGLTCLPKKLLGRVSSVSLTYVATTLLLSTVLVIKVSTKAIETGILLFIVDIKKNFHMFRKKGYRNRYDIINCGHKKKTFMRFEKRSLFKQQQSLMERFSVGIILA